MPTEFVLNYVCGMDMTVTFDEFKIAVDLADQTLLRFSSTRGHYNNTSNSHLRGKIGEIIVANFLHQLGIATDPVFKDLDKMADADIIVPGKCRIEVKTWSEEFWSSMGRCIAVDQYEKLRRKADLIIWCVSAVELKPQMQVKIVGWNLVSDVSSAPQRLTGPSNGRKVNNYQLDSAMLRPIENLQKHLGLD